MRQSDYRTIRHSAPLSRHDRGAARTKAQPRPNMLWMLGMLTAGGVMLFGYSMAHGQTPVPEVVRPHAEAPAARTAPQDGVVVPPAPAGSAAVIQPPAVGTMPVIPPPVAGTMPIIAPPGTAGGDRTVVPK